MFKVTGYKLASTGYLDLFVFYEVAQSKNKKYKSKAIERTDT